MFESWRRRSGTDAPGGLTLRNRPLATWLLLAANAVWWLVAELIGSTQDPASLLDFGANHGPLVAGGEYWRLLSSVFLHIGIMHLMLNSLGLLIYGMLLETAFGRLRFVLIYVAAGLAGSTVSFVANPMAISAGASGAIFGLLGALAACFLTGRGPQGRGSRRDAAGIAVLIAINLGYGLVAPGIDNWAHIGGLAMGFALGIILAEPPERDRVFPVFPRPARRSAGSNRRVMLAVPPIALLLVAGVWLGSSGVAGGLGKGRAAAGRPAVPARRFRRSQEVIDAGLGQRVMPTCCAASSASGLGDDIGALADLGQALVRGLTTEDRGEGRLAAGVDTGGWLDGRQREACAFGWVGGRRGGARDPVGCFARCTAPSPAGDLNASIEYVFCNREQGEAEGSDEFFRMAESMGVPLVRLSSQRFRRERGGGGMSRHRDAYHDEAMRLTAPYRDRHVGAGRLHAHHQPAHVPRAHHDQPAPRAPGCSGRHVAERNLAAHRERSGRARRHAPPRHGSARRRAATELLQLPNS